MDNYMETRNDDIYVTLENIIDRIPPKMALLEYNVHVMGVSYYLIELCITNMM